MLKQLVQLFAEKFLVSKKSWLYQNSIALKNDPITVFSGSTGISERNYTAPSNGMALVSFRKASAEDISCFVDVNGIRRQQLQNLKQGWEADATFTSLRVTFSTWQQEAVTQRLVSLCSIPHRNLSIGGASC